MTEDGMIEHLRATDVVRIATRTVDGREIITPIWSVVVDGSGYVRNGFGEASRWYRRATKNGGVAFADGPRRYAATLERADPGVLDTVDAAYLRKYRGQPTAAVVAEPARSYTLRVAPA